MVHAWKQMAKQVLEFLLFQPYNNSLEQTGTTCAVYRKGLVVSARLIACCSAQTFCVNNMRLAYIILIILIPSYALTIDKADLVVVKKSESLLYLKKNGKTLKKYKVSFGANPKGHKVKEGEERTPEGRYHLDYKKADSSFYKAIHISYPNEQDIKRARDLGVDPGGLIMVHGQKNGFGWLSFITQLFNWTDGCIALTNEDMDEVWESVDMGIPIDIKP
jgi:murein L,D-transpeptidase YafK